MTKNEVMEYVIKECKKWAEERRLLEQYTNVDALRANIHDEYAEFYRARLNKDTNEVIDAYMDTIIYTGVEANKRFKTSDDKELVEAIFIQEFDSAWEELPKLGFDFKKAIDETFKEINSRTGEWNEELGKWQKYTTEEAKALWYKADYKKALLPEYKLLPKELYEFVPKEWKSGFIKIKQDRKCVGINFSPNIALDLDSSSYKVYYFDKVW